nr:MAG TPA: hypothetical protein [Caudoviricetes sp.]
MSNIIIKNKIKGLFSTLSPPVPLSPGFLHRIYTTPTLSDVFKGIYKTF